MRPIYLPFLLAVLLLAGCTQAQVDRAEAALNVAKDNLAMVEAAEARAMSAEATCAKALAAAKALSDQVGNDATKRIVSEAEAMLAQAKEGLATVHTGVQVAKVGVQGADQAFKSAKAAYEAGGSTVDVLIAILGTAVPAVGGVLLALRKAQTVGKALKQTVCGLDEARASMGDAVWDQHVAPALESAQDAQVKAAIALAQARAKVAS